MSMHDRLPPAKLAEPLGEDEVHVWSCSYRAGSGRDALIRVLAAYLECEPAAVRLREEEHGRPTLDGVAGRPLRFNWSHSGDRALVAVSRAVQPGVDLEQQGRRRRDVLALARRFFSPGEADVLESFQGEERAQAFLRLWTCKEALLKAHGRGLAYGMHRVELRLAANSAALVAFDGESVADWQLHELPGHDDWVAALAWRGRPLRVCWRGSFD